MGTRSSYRVRETYVFEDKKTKEPKRKVQDLVLVYRQFDGYPEGHPKETAEWLASGEVVNGVGLKNTKLVFNGAGCLAAQLITRFKDSSDGTYIYPLNSRGKCWEDYTYDIVVDSDTNEITFIAYGNYGKKPVELFNGKPQDYPKFLEEYKLKQEAE